MADWSAFGPVSFSLAGAISSAGLGEKEDLPFESEQDSGEMASQSGSKRRAKLRSALLSGARIL